MSVLNLMNHKILEMLTQVDAFLDWSGDVLEIFVVVHPCMVTMTAAIHSHHQTYRQHHVTTNRDTLHLMAVGREEDGQLR